MRNYAVIKEIMTEDGIKRYLYGIYDLERAVSVSHGNPREENAIYTVIPENDLENWEIIEDSDS